MSKELIRTAGGIVHSDGNIFFTNQTLLDAYVAAIAQPVLPAEPICPLCKRRPVFVFDVRVREWSGECRPCGIVGPLAFTEMDAIKNWLHRYQETVTTQPVLPTDQKINALGQPSPGRTDFTTWSRDGLERFARIAADENLVLRTDLKATLAAWRQAVIEKGGEM